MLALAACSSEDASNGTLRVFAATSLSVAGDDLLELYAAEHDGQQIEWNFAGSSALVRQIEQGSPADAFISADEKNMDKALKLPEFGNVTDRGEPRIVATNQLVLAVAENPKTEINSLEDLRTVRHLRPGGSSGALALKRSRRPGAPVKLENPSGEAVSNVATKVRHARWTRASSTPPTTTIQRRAKSTTLPVDTSRRISTPASTDAGADNAKTPVRPLARPRPPGASSPSGFGPGDPE